MASLASLRLPYYVRYASPYLKLRNQRSIKYLLSFVGYSISDSLRNVIFSVLIYETIILQKAAGEKMKKILEFLTRNPVMGALAGALVTAVLQSSSATTVMVIGFVSAELMSLPQAISVIFGANIGTTITAILLQSVSQRIPSAQPSPTVFLIYQFRYCSVNNSGLLSF